MNVDPVCGKVQIKGKEGLRGMSLGEIEKLIMDATKNSNLDGEFKRYKTAVPKGESKRLKYCSFIKTKLPELWAKYNKANKAPAAAESTGVSKAFKEMLAKEGITVESETGPNNRVEVLFGQENEPAEMGNVNSNTEREINYANKGNFNQPRYATQTYVKNSRRKEQNMFAKGTPSRKLLKQAEAIVRRRKRAGTLNGNIKTQENLLKQAFLFKPGNVPKARTRAREPMPETKANRVAKRLKRTISFTNNTRNITTRRPTRSSLTINRGTKLSRAEIVKARNIANTITNKIMKVGKNKNFISEVLTTNTSKVNANRLANNISKINGFNRDNVRELVLKFQYERARVLKELGAPIAEPNKPVKKLNAFSLLPSGSNFANLVSMARKKKASDRTKSNRRYIRVAESFARMKSNERRGRERGAKMTVSTRPMNYRSNSNANSNSNENENEALPPPVIARGGNSNSNSNANENEMNKRRKQAVEVLRQKLNKLEFKPSGALKPYTIQNKVVKVRGVNVNTMSKVQLQNAARNIAKVIAPGQTIDFNKNIPQLVRFVKAGAKKILSKK